MDKFLYILLGCLDDIAIIGLMFSIFLLPVYEYLKEIFIASIVIAIVSYFMRNQFDLASLDPFVQLILIILFWRFVLKTRWNPAIIISLSGYLAFIGIQIILFLLLKFFGIVTLEDAEGVSGVGTYSLQIYSDIIVYVICFCLLRFNIGFSRFIRPPHDFFIKRKYTNNLKVIIAMSLLIFSFLFFLYIAFNHSILILLPLVVLYFLVIMNVTKKRDTV